MFEDRRKDSNRIFSVGKKNYTFIYLQIWLNILRIGSWARECNSWNFLKVFLFRRMWSVLVAKWPPGILERLCCEFEILMTSFLQRMVLPSRAREKEYFELVRGWSRHDWFTTDLILKLWSVDFQLECFQLIPIYKFSVSYFILK